MNAQTIRSENTKPITLGLVFDLPEKLKRTSEQPFPSFAEAEWETIETIRRISDGWKKIGFNVIEFPIDKNFLARWSVEHGHLDLIHSLVEGWGTPSREAWVPALCELSGVPYIGSSPFAQCVAMRKSTFKILCNHLQIPTPRFHIIQNEDDLHLLPDDFLTQPHFIKPDCEGSGMGIDAETSISTDAKFTRQICRSLLRDFPDGIILEELLEGIELTSAFLSNDPLEILPIAQIEVPTGVYGLANKSKDEMGEKVTFPRLPETITRSIHNAMQMLQSRIGLEDFTRFDWKLNRSGIPMLLEANPLAGLSYYYSVLPKIAAQAGYTYEDLLRRLATSALSRKNQRRFWYGRTRVHSSQT